jgi:2-keto-4-pentenoate hydratase/2-oxohepta-3-ene-1,7-dioic acid hydratase in catechol pathway
MKLANINGRAALVIGHEIADVADASEGRFSHDPMAIYSNWDEFVRWATTVTKGSGPLDRSAVLNPVPSPRQVFAVGLNYRAHAEESGMQIPAVPATFTKFPSSLAAPDANIEIHGPAIDWEVELVAVIGRRADRVAVKDSWQYIAGLTIGQDVSDRHLQFAAGAQFSLGKSRRGYGPMGPWLVTPDEFTDRDDLALSCTVTGEVMQQSRTSDLIFNVAQLVAELSAVLPLLPGDVIFTGTPSGVGAAQKPPRFLQPGDVVESSIEGIGSIINRCVEPVAVTVDGAPPSLRQ